VPLPSSFHPWPPHNLDTFVHGRLASLGTTLCGLNRRQAVLRAAEWLRGTAHRPAAEVLLTKSGREPRPLPYPAPGFVPDPANHIH
jgi:hypothetical protein